MKIILLGAPGVGKGTQAKLICESFKIPHISTGDIFRSNINKGTPLGVKVKDYIQKGELVPDNLTVSIVEDRIGKVDCKEGFLLDGFPRNINQAKELELLLSCNKQYIDKTIFIDAPKSLVIDRISGRRFCERCGSSYHIKYNPSKFKDRCEVCEEKLIQRQDDKENVVLDRLAIYNEMIKSILQYYSVRGILYKIQGNGDIYDVFSSICTTLKVV